MGALNAAQELSQWFIAANPDFSGKADLLTLLDWLADDGDLKSCATCTSIRCTESAVLAARA
jgi:hypothetical protein